MPRDERVIDFPAEEHVSPEERARRLQVEIERLACLPAVERLLWLEDSANTHAIEPAKLKTLVEAAVKEKEKKLRQEKTEERQRERRAEQQQASARREQQRAQERADKEAERKQRERKKQLVALLKLPSAEQELQLGGLAKRLDEDLDLLREAFAELVAEEETRSDITSVEPWPEPVDIGALLTEVMARLRCYVVVHDDAGAIAIVLWICFAWLHEIAKHSPILLLTGADGDEGKTTACGVVNFLTPRALRAAELTGPTFFHIIDQLHPTLIVDDADRLLPRRPDLTHLINVSWTPGTKIPRQHHGVTRWYDVFCAKVISGVNVQLAKTTATRCIKIRFLPKLPHENVEEFGNIDDETFQTLRRKLARWAADNAGALRDSKPVLPPGSNNRLAQNWRLQLAIADLAGGAWPKLARQAAVKLSRQRRDPSEGKRLLLEFYNLFAARGRYLTSDEVQTALVADKNSEWADFHGHGPISQRQIALLLDPYEIDPDVIHPPGRAAARGYRAEQFETAFRHYLGRPMALVPNRTSVRKRTRS